MPTRKLHKILSHSTRWIGLLHARELHTLLLGKTSPSEEAPAPSEEEEVAIEEPPKPDTSTPTYHHVDIF